MRKFSKISLLSVSLALSVQVLNAFNPIETSQDQYPSSTDERNNRYNSNFSTQSNGFGLSDKDQTKFEYNINTSNAEQNSSFDIFENGNASEASNAQDFSNQSVHGNFDAANNLNNQQFQNVNPQNQSGTTGSVDKVSQQSIVDIKTAPAARTPNSSDVPDNGSDPVDTPVNSAVYILFAIAAFFGFKSKLVIEKK